MSSVRNAVFEHIRSLYSMYSSSLFCELADNKRRLYYYMAPYIVKSDPTKMWRDGSRNIISVEASITSDDNVVYVCFDRLLISGEPRINYTHAHLDVADPNFWARLDKCALGCYCPLFTSPAVRYAVAHFVNDGILLQYSRFLNHYIHAQSRTTHRIRREPHRITAPEMVIIDDTFRITINDGALRLGNTNKGIALRMLFAPDGCPEAAKISADVFLELGGHSSIG